MFDGIVIKSRVVRLLPRGGAEALCRCKRWALVPFSYDDSEFRRAGVGREAGFDLRAASG